ncbi:M23 family metallopeptidase [Candidatus Wolfebacteria bacterium]|nr:M23 family metallopeptidase [Candidatus Wolfebacteria bacterium]
MKQATVLGSALLLAALSAGAQTLTTDGFNFPLNPPDGEGYGITIGANDFLTLDTTSYSCGAVYHPGQDLNALDGDDAGDSVYAAGDGTIKFAGQAGSCWGNIVLIGHTGTFALPEARHGDEPRYPIRAPRGSKQ